jgi:nicotinic acid mononucleotide adenylyltransferase
VTQEEAIAFPDVSSTEIRKRIRSGRSVEHLVPQAVMAEIQDLYQ